jgi:hypothetical protein
MCDIYSKHYRTAPPETAMQIQAPHPKDQSIAAYLAAMEILYHGSLAAALAAAPKSN